jgi:hypothetical protein
MATGGGAMLSNEDQIYVGTVLQALELMENTYGAWMKMRYSSAQEKELAELKVKLVQAATERFRREMRAGEGRGKPTEEKVAVCPLEGTTMQFCEDLECPVHGSRNRAWRLAKYPPRCPGCKLQMVETVSGGWGCPTLGTPGCMKDTGPTGHWTVEQILRREA